MDSSALAYQWKEEAERIGVRLFKLFHDLSSEMPFELASVRRPHTRENDFLCEFRHLPSDVYVKVPVDGNRAIADSPDAIQSRIQRRLVYEAKQLGVWDGPRHGEPAAETP
jgi:hypothetical protein